MLELDGEYAVAENIESDCSVDDIGYTGAAIGMMVGSVVGYGAGILFAGYTGYKVAEYINEEYLPDAGSAAHVGVDIAGVVVAEGLIGGPCAAIGAATLGAAGAAIGGLLDRE